MKGIALAFSGLLLATPAQSPDLVEQPPLEYQSLEPLTVTLTLADAQWVNDECARILDRRPSPGMVFEACAGIGSPWMIHRHGALYPDRCGSVVAHETGHVRGWNHADD